MSLRIWRHLCRLCLIAGVAVAYPHVSSADEPAVYFVLDAPAAFKVFGNPIDLDATGRMALEKAGCGLADPSSAGNDVFDAHLKASVAERSPAICAYEIDVVDGDKKPVYSVPRTVEDAICSLPWLQSEVERQLKIACDVAKGIVTRRMLSAKNSEPVQPAVVLPAPTPAADPSAKVYGGWGLVAGGTVVALLGTQLWMADGNSISDDHRANTTGGPVILGLGVAMIAAGALLVGGKL